MFDKIALRRSEIGSQLTAGDLAEALLFFQNVHIVLDQSALLALGKTVTMPTMLELLSRPNLSATYCDHCTVTMTKTIGGIQYHDFGTVSLVPQGARRRGGLAERLEHIMIEKFGHSRREARRYASLAVRLHHR
jgi:hypothetical protein